MLEIGSLYKSEEVILLHEDHLFLFWRCFSTIIFYDTFDSTVENMVSPNHVDHPGFQLIRSAILVRKTFHL